MKTKIEKLENKIKKHRGNAHLCENIQDGLKNLFGDSDNMHYTSIMVSLSSIEEKAKSKINKHNIKINEIREKCVHEYKEDGYDSHKNYYKCVHCGHEMSV